MLLEFSAIICINDCVLQHCWLNCTRFFGLKSTGSLRHQSIGNKKNIQRSRSTTFAYVDLQLASWNPDQ